MHRFVRTNTDRRERGDTLVEVMISIAVVSLILGGAYVTTNTSLQATRAAQERAIALKLAESQIERLKSLMSDNPGSVAAMTGNFCISHSNNLPVADTNAACTLNTTGVSAGANEEPKFRISIARNGDDFTLTETWVDISGHQNDSLQLRYRVYD